MLQASVCIHAGQSSNFSVPHVPTSTPQGYTTPSLHPHPQMRTLPLVLTRGTFRWAYLWSTLLALFLIKGSSAVLDNIIIGILQLVEGYFSSWYHLITHPDDSWTSKVQDYPHFLKNGVPSIAS